MSNNTNTDPSKSDDELCNILSNHMYGCSYDKLPKTPGGQRHRVKLMAKDVSDLFHVELEAREKQYKNDIILVHSDLMWCLGKLRGLGHPKEDMERKWTPNSAPQRGGAR